MSHRTEPLPPLSGVSHIVRELRYHEASRQIIGLLLCVYFAAISQPIPWAIYLTTVIVVIGVIIRMWASGFIMKNKELATNGPYALVRHPLYVGNILIVYAFAGASGIWWAFLIATAFFLFYYPPAIEYEDRKLCAIFGDAWREFAKNTPALMPALGSRQRDLSGHWSFKTSLKANLEPLIAVFLLACFAYIYTRL
ncbi:MAG: isoprenylcysteine carboxylmethyltransferase family protein [Gammaproteobacteria bacterium]|nr:isoprenylcysteine carboxylmethyltransferase family protein [Gammaproteobacteria bacterium]MDH3429941.1 isoprenylcysteine carboxylmethyltransferase family protein [Gammaproteobacteria bacterium]MDH3434111.1 isoprenylcysteine carboxylmethyltransferase family protein [Gammaproteobacteria bacterium]